MNGGDGNAVAVARTTAKATLRSDAVDRIAKAARLSAFKGIRLSYLPQKPVPIGVVTQLVST
jgi:hypothetical protein